MTLLMLITGFLLIAVLVFVFRNNKILATALAVFISLLLSLSVKAYTIPSGAMLETIQIGDRVLVNKLAYGFTDVSFGDIIVFQYPRDPSKRFIMRAIGLPGDRLEIRGKKVYRNGGLLNEPYAINNDPKQKPDGNPRDNMAEMIVPEERYFVMGDNRDRSFDSRFWGFVPREFVKGKADRIYWSWDAEAKETRWQRIGSVIH